MLNKILFFGLLFIVDNSILQKYDRSFDVFRCFYMIAMKLFRKE